MPPLFFGGYSHAVLRCTTAKYEYRPGIFVGGAPDAFGERGLCCFGRLLVLEKLIVAVKATAPVNSTFCHLHVFEHLSLAAKCRPQWDFALLTHHCRDWTCHHWAHAPAEDTRTVAALYEASSPSWSPLDE